MSHPNAKLTPRGRRELVRLVEEEGRPYRAAGAAFGVSASTAHVWVTRWRSASAEAQASLECLADRSSRPFRSPRRCPRPRVRRILRARSKTGWGPRLIAAEVGESHSTVSAVLARHGLSRAPKAARGPARRYEWPCPGDLLHMDTKRYARFDRPGHAVTGDRRRSRTRRRRPLGYEFSHALVDDRSRLGFAELLPDERAETVTAFTERALEWFAAQGIVARRIMTDNAFSYVHNRSLRELLEARGIRHLRTRPYTPRTNGKVERFHQTMQREWGYGVAYRSDSHRREALPEWLRYDNERRPHSALGGQAPISRARNLSGQDS